MICLHLERSLARMLWCIILVPVTIPPLFGQSSPTVFATGLVAPQGIEIDDEGRLWVAEQGTGDDDGRISIVTSDGQVHPFLTGLPSNIVQGNPESVHHLLLQNGVVWATLGLGETSPQSDLLRIDINAFSPGDPPLSMTDVQLVEDVGSFVRGFDFAANTDQTNIYNLTIGPDDDLFIVDASANAVVRRRSTDGTLSIFAELPTVPNPTSVGPPASQAVPTGIVFSRDRFYVSAFPGFPFAEGMGRIFEIDLDGNVATHLDGLTAAVDLVMNANEDLVVAQFGRFSTASGFQPRTGSIILLAAAGPEVLASNLNFPAGMALASNGDLYFTSFLDGEVLRLDANEIGTALEPLHGIPQQTALLQNYPNPFNPATTIEYRLTNNEYVEINVHDLLGRPVRRLVEGMQTAGRHAVTWDGRNAAGEAVSSGIYLYRMIAGGRTLSGVMHVVK